MRAKDHRRGGRHFGPVRDIQAAVALAASGMWRIRVIATFAPLLNSIYACQRTYLAEKIMFLYEMVHSGLLSS